MPKNLDSYYRVQTNEEQGYRQSDFPKDLLARLFRSNPFTGPFKFPEKGDKD